MNLGLKDKVVVVTGASKGIGFSCAEAFAREGARVVLVSRSEANLDAALARFPATTRAPLAIAADLCDPAAAARSSTSSARAARARTPCTCPAARPTPR